MVDLFYGDGEVHIGVDGAEKLEGARVGKGSNGQLTVAADGFVIDEGCA